MSAEGARLGSLKQAFNEAIKAIAVEKERTKDILAKIGRKVEKTCPLYKKYGFDNIGAVLDKAINTDVVPSHYSIAEVEQELTNLEQELTDTKTKNWDLEFFASELDNNQAFLTGAVAEVKKAIKGKLANQLKVNPSSSMEGEETDTVLAAYGVFAEKLNKLNERLKKVQEELELKESVKRELEIENTTLKNCIQVSKAKFHKLEEDFSNLKLEHEHLKEYKEKLAQDKTKEKKELEKLEKSKGDLLHECEELDKKSKCANGDLLNLQKEVDEKKVIIGKLSQENSMLQDQVNNTKELLKQAEENLQKTKKELETKTRELKKLEASLEEQNKSFTARYENMEQERKRFKEEISKFNSDLERLENRVNKNQVELDKVEKELALKKHKVSKCDKVFEIIKGQFEEISKQFAQKEKSLQDMEFQYQNLCQKHTAKMSEIQASCTNWRRTIQKDIKDKNNVEELREKLWEECKELEREKAKHKDAINPTIFVNLSLPGSGVEGTTFVMHQEHVSQKSLEQFHNFLAAGDVDKILSVMATKCVNFTHAFPDKGKLVNTLKAFLGKPYERIYVNDGFFDKSVLAELEHMAFNKDAKKVELFVEKGGLSKETVENFNKVQSKIILKVID